LPPPDPLLELERAATKQREREATAAAAKEQNARPPKPAADQNEDLVRKKLVHSALARAGRTGGKFLIVPGILFVSPIVTLQATTKLVGKDPRLLLAAALGFGLMLAYSYVLNRIVAGRRKRQLFRVGRGFDANAYLQALGHKRHETRVVATLTFSRPWKPEQQELAAVAARGWVQLDLKWLNDGATLELSRDRIETTELSGGKRNFHRKHFTNEPVHTQVDGVLNKVVPHLHAVNPVEHIAVEVSGKVSPFDAEP
jgi:hypothetical protein